MKRCAVKGGRPSFVSTGFSSAPKWNENFGSATSTRRVARPFVHVANSSSRTTSSIVRPGLGSTSTIAIVPPW